MKTDALIALLATGPVAVERRAVERRLAAALAVGLGVAFGVMWAALGPRPDLASAASQPMFWLKMIVPVLLAAASGAAALRLASPGGKPVGAWAAAAAMLGLLWVGAGLDLMQQPAAGRLAMVLGTSAWSCVASIALLALPPMAALVVALRSLAPTRPVEAGLSAGALAGSLAAAVYAVHCDETALPFLAVWYMLGIGVPAALGAAFGRRWLRWI